MLKADPFRQSEARAGYPASTYCIDDEQTRRLYEILEKVSSALDGGDVATAERHLGDGLRECPGNPRLQAYLSICMASAGRELKTAEELARSITREFPREAAGHFALGRVKLIADKRRFAFQNFQRARRLARSDQHMVRELGRMEPRRRPVFAGLARDHFLNILFGRARARLQGLFGHD